jgi:hypothetical protein
MVVMSSSESDESPVAVVPAPQDGDATLLDAALLEACRALVDAVVRTLKTARLYAADNPVHQQALETIGQRLAEHVAEHGPLTLCVARDHLHLMGVELYRDETERDGLSARLHADGVRAIHFKDGLEVEEGTAAVAMLARGTTAVADFMDDDLVTLFWEAALQHVDLTVVADDPALPELGADVVPPEAATLAQVTGTTDAAAASPSVALGPEVLEMFRLTEADQAHVDGLIEADQALDPDLSLLSIVMDVLSIEPDPGEFSGLIDVYARYLSQHLARGRFDLARVQVTGLLALKANRPELSGRMARALDTALANLATADGMAALSDGLGQAFGGQAGNQDDDPESAQERKASQARTIADLTDYLSALEGGDAGATLRAAVAAPSGPVRDRLLETASRFCAISGVTHLMPLLKDTDFQVICCAIRVIGEVGQVTDLSDLADFTGHDDLEVRRMALDAIAAIAPSGHTFLLPFLRDGESALRRRALAVISGVGYTEAVNVLQGMVGGALFATMRMGERRAIFCAIGSLGKDDTLDFFAPYLVRRRLLWGKRKGEDEALCSVSGLKAVGTDAAKEALVSACRHHNERVRAASKFALRELEGTL